MADVNVIVAGRHYKLSCRDGEEDHLHKLVAMVDSKATDLTGALGEMTEGRTLLLSALLLADELNDLRSRPAPAAAPSAEPVEAEPDPAYAVAVERLAERIERLASQLDRAAE